MKTIFTLLLATIFSSAAFAYGEGKITITIPVNKNVQVYVDGRLYQDNDNTIVLNNVRSGNHTIRIYQAKKNSRNNKKNNRINERKDALVYSSTIYVKPSYHVDVVVNRFGKALVDEKAMNDRNGSWDDEDWDNEDWNDDYNGGYHKAITEYEFNQILTRIQSQWFGKLSNAKEAINQHYFSTTQVKQLIQLFTSESEKLQIAKVAYPKTVDRQNFRQLYNLFSYSSQSELDRFIRDYH